MSLHGSEESGAGNGYQVAALPGLSDVEIRIEHERESAVCRSGSVAQQLYVAPATLTTVLLYDSFSNY